MLISLPNKFKLEHLKATLDDIETLKDQARYIIYSIVSAYSDDIAGLGSIDRLWKDLIASSQWAKRKLKIDPKVVTITLNVSPRGVISTLLKHYMQFLIEYSL